MIFQHQNSLGVAGQLVTIQNGLRNWITIWERYFDAWSTSYPHGAVQDTTLSPETMWRRMGFIRFAPEYWLLGSLLTDRISASSQQQPAQSTYPSPGSHGDAGESQRAAQVKSIEPILDKYDQTSMRQVNDLIIDFQRFHVE